MADVIGLHGNGEQCPACALRREEANRGLSGPADVPCNNCGGTGWAQYSEEKIVKTTVAAARRDYWPARERAFQAHNRRIKCRASM